MFLNNFSFDLLHYCHALTEQEHFRSSRDNQRTIKTMLLKYLIGLCSITRFLKLFSYGNVVKNLCFFD